MYTDRVLAVAQTVAAAIDGDIARMNEMIKQSAAAAESNASVGDELSGSANQLADTMSRYKR